MHIEFLRCEDGRGDQSLASMCCNTPELPHWSRTLVGWTPKGNHARLLGSRLGQHRAVRPNQTCMNAVTYLEAALDVSGATRPHGSILRSVRQRYAETGRADKYKFELSDNPVPVREAK